MSERIPPREAIPPELEVRRDALLLRIKEMRDAVKGTDLDQDLVSKELDELDIQVQKVKGLLDMDLFEQMFDSLEHVVDKHS